MDNKKNKSLGRGLESLLSVGIDNVDENDKLTIVDIDKIIPGKYQPRAVIDEESIRELAESIKSQGVIQPIIVRESGLSSYEIIAGERRWRASKFANLKEIPVIIKNISDKNALAIGLIENIQRRNLNPIEEAEGFHRLVEEFKLTHEKIAEVIGRSRSSISNSLRLLNLPEKIRELVFNNSLTMGHVRALLTLPENHQVTFAKKAVAYEWSVRKIENEVKKYYKLEKDELLTDDAYYEDKNLQKRLANIVDMKSVNIKYNKKGEGKITFSFNSLEQLESLINRLDNK